MKVSWVHTYSSPGYQSKSSGKRDGKKVQQELCHALAGYHMNTHSCTASFWPPS